MFYQKTIQNLVKVSGIGIHSGKNVSIDIDRAKPNNGISFNYVHNKKTITFPVQVFLVKSAFLATTLKIKKICISTIEHVMSSLSALGIDNVNIKINSNEIPILDGSSTNFIYLFLSSGIIEQPFPKKYINVIKEVNYFSKKDKNIWARLESNKNFNLRFFINFKNIIMKYKINFNRINMYNISYIKKISKARTFGFFEDFEKLKSIGLIKGGCLSNAIVINRYNIINKQKIRYFNEFVNHKILDSIGDLYMLNKSLIATYTANMAGHFINNKLLKKLFKNLNCWNIVYYKN